jgi:hypothetical protein
VEKSDRAGALVDRSLSASFLCLPLSLSLPMEEDAEEEEEDYDNNNNKQTNQPGGLLSCWWLQRG